MSLVVALVVLVVGVWFSLGHPSFGRGGAF